MKKKQTLETIKTIGGLEYVEIDDTIYLQHKGTLLKTPLQIKDIRRWESFDFELYGIWNVVPPLDIHPLKFKFLDQKIEIKRDFIMVYGDNNGKFKYYQWFSRRVYFYCLNGKEIKEVPFTKKFNIEAATKTFKEQVKAVIKKTYNIPLAYLYNPLNDWEMRIYRNLKEKK